MYSMRKDAVICNVDEQAGTVTTGFMCLSTFDRCNKWYKFLLKDVRTVKLYTANNRKYFVRYRQRFYLDKFQYLEQPYVFGVDSTCTIG